MRISDDFLECVCFLCVKDNDTTFKLVGTGFFITVPSAVHAGIAFLYLVTAKHCVVEGEKVGGLFVRLNTHEGKSQFLAIPSAWRFPDDPSADVAVLPCRPDDAVFRYKTLPLAMFATATKIAEKNIGVGDDLVLIGLFVRHAGQDRNIPIVRTGVIAAMPTEPIKDSVTGLDYYAYIAEVRSIGGLSGSPVFGMLGPVRNEQGSLILRLEAVLLGVIRGHWDEKNHDAIGAIATPVSAVNMGMAVVTPIEHVVAVLDGESLAGLRAADDTTRTLALAEGAT